MTGETPPPPAYDPAIKFKDVPALLHEFKAADRGLASICLPHMAYFNSVYGAGVTQKTYDYTQQPGFFEHPATVLNNMTNFGGYWFRPVGAQANSEYTKVPGIWLPPFFDPRAQDPDAPPARKLAVGVNSHVTYDLGISVEETGFDPDYFDDYQLVDIPIRETVDEILDEYMWVPRIYRARVVDGITSGVGRMRMEAWSIAKRLHKAGTDQDARNIIKYEAFMLTMRRHEMILGRSGRMALRALLVPDRAIERITGFRGASSNWRQY